MLALRAAAFSSGKDDKKFSPFNVELGERPNLDKDKPGIFTKLNDFFKKEEKAAKDSPKVKEYKEA